MTTSKPRRSAQSPQSTSTQAIIVACFFLSGFAALLYQIAWLRQFSFVFGTSELAVVTVLAAYLAGLSAGAAIAARYVARVRRPVWTYGLLEAGIAGSALAVPLLLALIGTAYVWMLGDQAAPPDAAAWGQPLFYVVVAFAVLALPTGFMGATLPLLARSSVHADREIGPKVGLLYGINTLGAVFGALAAGFVLLPTIGLDRTVWTGVAVNLAIFGLVASLTRARRGGQSVTGRLAAAAVAPARTGFYSACVRPWLVASQRRAGGVRATFREQPTWILPVMLLSGANAFVYEVLWTRLLTHVLGGSIYSFATMLAAFLGGIALGSGLATRFARERDRAAAAFVIVQIAIAMLSMLIFTLLGPLLPETRGTAELAAYAAAVMLPATAFLGASFPLAVRILAGGAGRVGADTARVYAWNTAGAIAGAVLAGFVLIPALGFEGTIKLAAATNLGLALWVAVCVAARKPLAIGISAAGLIAAILVYAPSRPGAVVAATGFPIPYNTDPRELFYSVGRSATVLLLEEDGYYYLRSNGLPEASISAKGSSPLQDPEKWLAALPVAARPDAESMLLIGFGGGVALEGVPPSVRDVDVIELEPEIINANRQLAGHRNIDPLEDPRVNIITNDARNALRLTSKRYDAIVSQPSHPWTGGAAHLYTADFLAEAKTHLTDGGVFVQWINAEFVDEPLLRTLAATLISEFESVRLYLPNSQVLVFLASDETLEPELQLSRSGKPITDDIMHYSRMGMNGVEDLIAALAMDEAGVTAFAADAPISTDDNLLMATRSRSRADGLVYADLAELFAPHDPLLTRGSWIYSRLADRIDFGYITRQLIRLGRSDRAAAAAGAQPDESTRLTMYGLLYRAQGRDDEAATAFRAALNRRPDNAQARYLLLEPNIAQLEDAAADSALVRLAEPLPASAAAVIRGWQHASNQEWEALAQIDPVLGRGSITDAWYPEAVRLRAEWRRKVTQNTEAFGFDALRLIDRAILIEPNRNLYLMRAAIGIALADGGVAIESSRQIVRVLRESLDRAREEDVPVTRRDLLIIQQNLNAIVTNLRGDLVAGDERRAEDVTREANELLRYIEAVLASADQ